MLYIDSMCEVFNCLPGPGGLFDQDPQLIEALFLVKAAKAEKRELERKK